MAKRVIEVMHGSAVAGFGDVGADATKAQTVVAVEEGLLAGRILVKRSRASTGLHCNSTYTLATIQLTILGVILPIQIL